MWENVRNVLNDMGREFQFQVREKIVAENAVATGDLLNSIGFEIEEDADGLFTLYLTHADYFHYVNENTVPHWPPREPILRWVEDKPLQPYPDANGKLPTVDQLTFLVSRKIAEEGTQGHYFFESVLNDLLEVYYPKIVDAIYADIEVELEGLI